MNQFNNINDAYIILGSFASVILLLMFFLRPKKKTKINMSSIDKMTGIQFEEYFMKILKDYGFSNINMTSASSDYGVDLLATKSGKKYALQLKRYSAKVGVSAVQQAISGSLYYSCKIPCVVTNSYFTAQAKKMADKCNVILIDRNNFLEQEFKFK